MPRLRFVCPRWRGATSLVALAALQVLSGCGAEFPGDYFVVDATKMRTPVMLSSTRTGRGARLVNGRTILIDDFVVALGPEKASETLLRQVRRRDRWLQIERATFTGHDDTSWEFGVPLGRTMRSRELTITGTAYR